MAAAAPQACTSRGAVTVVAVLLVPLPATTRHLPAHTSTALRTRYSRSPRSSTAASPVQPTGTTPATPASTWRASSPSHALRSIVPSASNGVTSAV